MYGLVEWTDAAAAAIGAKEYRYLSPLFGTDKKGRVVRFANVALVNMPAIDLEAIAANAQFPPTKGPIMDKDLLEALGLSEGASEADVLAAIQALQSGTSAIALAAGLDKDADSETIAAAVTAFAAQATADDAKPDPAKYVPVEQVEALQATLTALTDKIDGKDAETAVAAAIEQGKLAPALKDWGLEFAKTNLEGFEAFTAKAPVLTGAQLGNTPKTEGDPDLDATDLQVMSQMGLSREEMVASKKDLDA
nr:phage protease [Roseibium sp.]